jgi:DNA-binding transcriptional regulator YhcF (GntR family)
MALLDPDDTRPPYAQVVDLLRQEIEQGVLQPGEKLPTHQDLVAQYGVSVGTIKRALGELQGAGLIISRQGQGAFVRTRRNVLESVPHSFSADVLAGLWVTCYKFTTENGTGVHADITTVTPQTSRRITAVNYPPEPRTQTYVPAFRNDIDAQLANRHLIGHWKNNSDTRYFGSVHLAVLPGECVMEGYYTAFLTDISVDAMPWKWVRIDPVSLAGVKVPQLLLKDAERIYSLLTQSSGNVPLSVFAIAEEGQ